MSGDSYRDNIESQSGQLAQPTLAQLEAIIEKGLPHYEEVAIAIFEIHDRKLFKPESFQSYLRRRWNLSRSRGYQLLHFARLKKTSTVVDIDNERKARNLKSDGSAKTHEELDIIEEAMIYIIDIFERLPMERRRKLIDWIRGLLDDFEKALTRTGE